MISSIAPTLHCKNLRRSTFTIISESDNAFEIEEAKLYDNYLTLLRVHFSTVSVSVRPVPTNSRSTNKPQAGLKQDIY